MLADVSAMMSSKLRRHCNHFSFFNFFLRDVFPQLPVQPSTEYTCTDTLNSEPFLIFDGTCHKHNKKNRHPSINCHCYRGKSFCPSVILLRNSPLTPSVHSLPVIDRRCDKAVPHSYQQRKCI